MSSNNVALVYAKGIVYRIPFWYMSKDNAISIMKNSNLTDKKGVFWYFFLFIMYKKMSDLTYYQRNRHVILNKANHYYEDDKERLTEKDQ